MKGGESMRKHRSEPMPLNLAVIMLLIGILLGSVFTFGMQYWNAKTTRESCAVVKTKFISYDEIWHAKPYLEYAVYGVPQERAVERNSYAKACIFQPTLSIFVFLFEGFEKLN